jgi:hypothetical protein
MDVKYVVSIEGLESANAALKNFDKAIDNLGKSSATTSKFGGLLGDTFKNLVPAFTVANLAAEGIRKTFGFLKDSVVDSVKAAIDAEKVDRALESTLEIVGQSAGGTADKLRRYADALMRQTLYDDEAIKSAQALIIQMRGTASQIDLATKGAIGLASVFGMDLQSAAKAVALGFEGNYRQLNQLIPAIRNATTDGEKHSIMMKEFAKYYQRAESDVGTFGGKIVDLKDAYNELQESVGKFVTQNKTVIETLSGVKEIIIWMDRKAQEQPKDKGLLGRLFEFTGPGGMLAAVRGIGKAAKEANAEWDASVEGMTAGMLDFRKTALDPLPVIIRQKFIAPLTESGKAIQDEIRWLRMLGAANIWNPIKTNFGSLGNIVGGVAGEIIDFQETVPGLFENLNTGTKAVTESTTGMADVWDMAMLSMTAGLVSFGDANATIWGNIGSIFENFAKSFISAAESVVLKEIWMATMASKADRAEAQSAVAKWWLKILPPPFSFIAAAASFAVVNALFSKLLKFEHGGIFKEPTLAMVGHGTEYVLPERRLERLIETTVIKERMLAGGGAGGGMHAEIYLTINAQTLDDRIIAQAGNKIFREVEAQARLHGWKLGPRR